MARTGDPARPASPTARDPAVGKYVWAETQARLREAASKYGITAAIALPDN